MKIRSDGFSPRVSLWNSFTWSGVSTSVLRYVFVSGAPETVPPPSPHRRPVLNQDVHDVHRVGTHTLPQECELLGFESRSAGSASTAD
ncbi:hypothetical protein [Streptomyces acidiscabies]|uniref:hypothetical protein n=1 Tax=Streptomyces acidiscabies TaxID=42234 RepID=UPI0038F760DB